MFNFGKARDGAGNAQHGVPTCWDDLECDDTTLAVAGDYLTEHWHPDPGEIMLTTTLNRVDDWRLKRHLPHYIWNDTNAARHPLFTPAAFTLLAALGIVIRPLPTSSPLRCWECWRVEPEHTP